MIKHTKSNETIHCVLGNKTSTVVSITLTWVIMRANTYSYTFNQANIPNIVIVNLIIKYAIN